MAFDNPRRIARLRRQEQERRQRIFDEPWRTIGVNKADLDRQVREKELAQQKRTQWENDIYEKLLQADQAKVDRGKREDVWRHGLFVDAERSWRQQLERREQTPPFHQPPWELSPVSSMRRFVGEDERHEDNLQLSSLSFKHVLEDQMNANRYIAAEQKRENDRLIDEQIEKDRRLADVEREKQSKRHQMLMEIAMCNDELARARPPDDPLQTPGLLPLGNQVADGSRQRFVRGCMDRNDWQGLAEYGTTCFQDIEGQILQNKELRENINECEKEIRARMCERAELELRQERKKEAEHKKWLRKIALENMAAKQKSDIVYKSEIEESFYDKFQITSR